MMISQLNPSSRIKMMETIIQPRLLRGLGGGGEMTGGGVYVGGGGGGDDGTASCEKGVVSIAGAT
jgi:hypothetical protein